jgi:hypothetical protein
MRGIRDVQAGKHTDVSKRIDDNSIIEGYNVFEPHNKPNLNYELKETELMVIDGNKREKKTFITKSYNFGNYFIMNMNAYNILGELSKPAYRLLGYILNNLYVDKPKFNLILKDAAACLGEKYANVLSNAKKELIEKNIIEPYKNGKSSEYLLNVELLFKGRRNMYMEKLSILLGEEPADYVIIK